VTDPALKIYMSTNTLCFCSSQEDMALEVVVEEVVVVEAVVEEATAPGDTSRLTDPLVSSLSARTLITQRVQSAPVKRRLTLFYPVSIQQASVLSRRGEEVSKGIVRPAAGYIEAVSQTQNHS
jgi:hypothetical protein